MKDKEPLKSVTIYLRGAELDPAYISETLRIQPTRAQKRGGLRAGSKTFKAKIGIWALKIKDESSPISDLVEKLLDKIVNLPTRLDDLQGVEDAHLDILYAFGDKEKESVEFQLTKGQVAKASELGLSICVTVM